MNAAWFALACLRSGAPRFEWSIVPTPGRGLHETAQHISGRNSVRLVYNADQLRTPKGYRGWLEKRPWLDHPAANSSLCSALAADPSHRKSGLPDLRTMVPKPGQARVRWERWTEHVAPLPLSNAFGSCIRHF
jgi:hypothetical protein